MSFSLPDHDFSKQIIVEKPALDNVMILAYSGVWETEKENLRMYIDKESITVSFEGSYWEDKGVEKYEIKKAIIDNIERAEGPEEFTFTSRVTDKFKVKDIRGETFTYIRKD